jgi:hypothetical protein
MSANRPLSLQNNRPQMIAVQRPLELRVESGIVWITGRDLDGDVFLRAGESLVVPRSGRLLAEAVGEQAEVRLVMRQVIRQVAQLAPGAPERALQHGRRMIARLMAACRSAVSPTPTL